MCGCLYVTVFYCKLLSRMLILQSPSYVFRVYLGDVHYVVLVLKAAGPCCEVRVVCECRWVVGSRVGSQCFVNKGFGGGSGVLGRF